MAQRLERWPHRNGAMVRQLGSGAFMGFDEDDLHSGLRYHFLFSTLIFTCFVFIPLHKLALISPDAKFITDIVRSSLLSFVLVGLSALHDERTTFHGNQRFGLFAQLLFHGSISPHLSIMTHRNSNFTAYKCLPLSASSLSLAPRPADIPATSATRERPS